MTARILVVEDEPGVRDFVKRGLLSVGHDVVTAEDGQQALEYLEKQKFDLMVTDIVMPGIDGIALSLKAAKDHPDLKILMMTGYSTERQRAHNLETLIHTVLAKPFSLKALLDAVDHALKNPRMN
jgi:DNA-binding NtrC family response regulator